MTPIVLLVLLIVAIRIFVNLLKPTRSKSWPVRGTRVLTEREQSMYWRLIKALPDHVVFSQVQLSRFIQPVGRHGTRAVFNRLVQKSADYVVCAKDFSVVAVIELDDSTHDRPAVRKRDADKNAACEAAGIKMIRWRSIPDVDAIQLALLGEAVRFEEIVQR